jgi:hypothetical protein
VGCDYDEIDQPAGYAEIADAVNDGEPVELEATNRGIKRYFHEGGRYFAKKEMDKSTETGDRILSLYRYSQHVPRPRSRGRRGLATAEPGRVRILRLESSPLPDSKQPPHYGSADGGQESRRGVKAPLTVEVIDPMRRIA